jgi:branched-chain amino acid transport system substrate-binding protein
MEKARVAVVVVTIAVALSLFVSPTWAQQKGPIKIGFIVPVSGAFAQVGKDMTDGLQLYLEDIGYQAAGRKIEVITEDDEAVPATTLIKARKLVEKDGVHVVFGTFLGASGYALGPYVDSKQIPAVMPIVSPDDLTQRQRSKWLIRTGWNSSQPNHPFGEYAYDVMKSRKIISIAPDFATGWECVGGFQKTFEEKGGRILQKIWFSIGTKDFSPYFSQIAKAAPDALYVITAGRETIQFFNQYQDFGLKGKIPVIGPGMPTDEHTLPSQGDEMLGVITVLHYSAALDNPVNKAFVKKFRERAKKIPGYYAETCNTGGRWMVEAIKAIQGDVENRSKFMEALRKVELKDIPRGPMKLDTYSNPIQNIYVRKVERVGGELQNTVIHTFPNVSQFWKYKPEEFLKQPVYSREFPPLKQ